MPFHKLRISRASYFSTCYYPKLHYFNLPFCHYHFTATVCHLVNWPSYQLAILSTCWIKQITFHQPAISAGHLIKPFIVNLAFGQLANISYNEKGNIFTKMNYSNKTSSPKSLVLGFMSYMRPWISAKLTKRPTADVHNNCYCFKKIFPFLFQAQTQ